LPYLSSLASFRKFPIDLKSYENWRSEDVSTPPKVALSNRRLVIFDGSGGSRTHSDPGTLAGCP